MAMWRAADKMPCLLLVGDFYQLPIVDRDARRCCESGLWKPNVKVVNFKEQVRCKDEVLRAKLELLRTAKPSQRQLDKRLLRGHRSKVWTTNQPDGWDVLELLRAHPDTTIATCTSKGAALINELATQVLFRDRHKKPWASWSWITPLMPKTTCRVMRRSSRRTFPWNRSAQTCM